MRGSSVYQMIIERGIEQGIEQGIERGEKKNTIENILTLLDRRFNVSNAPVLSDQLETIDDLQQLKALFHEAIDVEHLENFVQMLQTYQNGN